MRENSATVQPVTPTSVTSMPDLVLIDCPACAATGWVPAVADSPDLVIECPLCDGHSWVSAVTR